MHKSNAASLQPNTIPAQVSGGVSHSLALLPDGTVWAWGSNQYGQLGNKDVVTTITVSGNTISASSTPVQVSDLTDITAISAGGGHNLAVKNNGTVWAWGVNYDGQLGDGTTADSNAPVQVMISLTMPLTDIIAISAGAFHNLALKSDGTVWAWGSNGLGLLGNGTTDNSSTPVQVNGLTSVIAIARPELITV